MNWEIYEKEVHEHLSRLYPGTPTKHNVELPGRYSKRNRQIDVLIEDDVAGFNTRVVVDCKHRSRRLDVTHVECFIGLLEDVDATHGLLVTPRGYSEAAMRRAHNHPKQILLDVMNLSDLRQYQGFLGIPYSGNRAMRVSAPFGWILDAGRNESVLATLYQRGRTLKQAQAAHEWMYVNLWHKDDAASTLLEVMDMQTRRMASEYDSLETHDLRGPDRDDGHATRIRVAKYNDMPFKEITGYIDGEDFITFFVLFTIPELEEMNTRKLAHVLRYSTHVELKVCNERVIRTLKDSIGAMTDAAERADAYTQIAIWYAEMGQYETATQYSRRSFRTSPTVYRNFHPLITAELGEGSSSAAAECAKTLFRLDPQNPRTMQDIMQLYESDRYDGALGELVQELMIEHEGNLEAEVNIGFHYGMLLLERKRLGSAEKTLRDARANAQAISGDHPALPGIDEMLGKIGERGSSEGQGPN